MSRSRRFWRRRLLDWEIFPLIMRLVNRFYDTPYSFSDAFLSDLACDLNYLSTYRDPWSPSLSSSASHSPVPSDCELDSSSGYVYVGEDSQNTIEKMLLQCMS